VATDDSTGIAAEATRWQKEIEGALAQAPDSERHDWAVRELIARLRGDPESDADLWAWASRALDTAARKANVGVDEAARLAQAYRSVPESSKAAPVFAAAAAAGWTNDARQAPFLESIPVGERADVHAQLLRTLDHRPSSGFTDHVIRLVRETTDDALLRSVFDEDRAAAAAAAPDRGRDVVLAYADRLADARLAKLEYGLEVSDAAVGELAKVGFDPVYGARPLKRAIQSALENPLAKAILEGRFAPKDPIRADWRGGRMTFEKSPARAAA
jgi:hypothetical protein